MDTFKILLTIHVISGAIGFIVAPVALIVKKGSQSHRRWGKVFFWSMTSVALTAIIMAPMHHNMFLTLVAVFSFYLAFSGYRSLYRKNVYKTHKTAFIDWFFVVLNILFSLSLIVYGIIYLPNAFGIIAIVFGLIGSYFGIKHIYYFFKPSPDKFKWFYSHMSGMFGSYIAALSAFSAVNFNFDWLPTAIQWLWPTIIGAPLIYLWIRSYKIKFSNGRKIREEAIITIQAEDVE